jgi:hypothetical protein
VESQNSLHPGYILNNEGHLMLNKYENFQNYLKSLHEYNTIQIQQQSKENELEREIKEMGLKLTKLQIKEAKSKKVWAFWAAIGSAILTTVLNNLSAIGEFLQKLLHR